MSHKYPVDMSDWRTTPIVRPINSLTGLIEGDDTGYRDMITLKHNRSPLVVPNVLIRASYDGLDEFGEKTPRLPGGLAKGELILRETAARGIELLDQLVFEASDGQFIIAALDGFRSEQRQIAGFNRLLKEQMALIGLTDEAIPQRIADFMACGGIADGTFSYVKLRPSKAVEEASQRLKNDADLMAQVADFLVRSIESGDIRDLRQGDFEGGITELLTISANYGVGPGAGLPLNSEGNAHAGAAACDVFMIEAATGRPINPVYFDYPGQEAGMDFMEHEGSYEAYLAAVREKPLLRQHLVRLGYTDLDSFTQTEWEYFQGALRILYHAAKGAGFTYYSSEHGGENWHLESGNIIYEPSNGNVVACEGLTASLHPNSGNPGHTLQTLGRKAVAVWGGATAHSLARLNYGL